MFKHEYQYRPWLDLFALSALLLLTAGMSSIVAAQGRPDPAALIGACLIRPVEGQAAREQERQQTDKAPSKESKVAIESGNPQHTRVYTSSAAHPIGQTAWDSHKLFVLKRGVTEWGQTTTMSDSTGSVSISGPDIFRPYNDVGYSDPIVASGILYFSVYIGDGYLYAIDARTGETKWRAKREMGKYSPPVVADDTLFVGADSGLFYAIDLKTNKEKWRHTRTDQSAVRRSPNVADGIVYYASTKGTLYALDANTGQLKWTFETPSQFLFAPALGEGIVYLADPSGIFGLDGKSGKKIWRLDVEEGVRSLAVAHGLIYFTDLDGHILTAVGGTGQRQSAPYEDRQTGARIVIKGETLYFLGWDSGSLFAADAATRETKWKSATTSGLRCNAPVADDSRLYLTCSDGRVYAVDAASGKKVWASERRNTRLSPPVVADGIVCFIGDDGKAHAVK